MLEIHHLDFIFNYLLSTSTYCTPFDDISVANFLKSIVPGAKRNVLPRKYMF